MDPIQPKLHHFVAAWLAMFLLQWTAYSCMGAWRALLVVLAAACGAALWYLELGGEAARVLLGPLARYVPWLHLQSVLWRRYWKLYLKDKIIWWFMKPYAPIFQQLPRSQVYKGAHRRGLYLKSATKKHKLIEP
jgi:hypothetical protein